MKKQSYLSLIGLFILAIAVSGFSGCGNSSQSSSNDKKSTEQTAQTPVPPPSSSSASNTNNNNSASSSSVTSTPTTPATTTTSPNTPAPSTPASSSQSGDVNSLIKATFDEKSKEIMLAAAKVYGGLEKPIDLRDLTIVSKATGPSPVGGQLTLDMIFYLKAPDKIKTVTSGLLPGQKIVVGYDGKLGWTQILSGTVALQTKEVPKDQLRQLSAQLAQNLARVNNPFVEAMKLERYLFQYRETVTLASGPADVIVLRSPDGKATKFFVDQKSHDIIRSEQSNGVDTIVTTFSDFRAVEGRRTPYLIQTLQEDKVIAGMEINEMKINTGIEDAFFAKPETK